MVSGLELVFGLIVALIGVALIIKIVRFFVNLAIKVGLIGVAIAVIWYVLRYIVGIEMIPAMPFM